MTKKEFEKIERSRDEYGNNIDFQDDILSDITIQGLLGKWVTMVLDRVIICLHQYYDEDPDRPVDEVSFYFVECRGLINTLTPVLEDLVAEEIYGLEDIIIAVYGIRSDEIYLIRSFLHLCDKIDSRGFDADYMFNNAKGTGRLQKILYGKDNIL